MAVKKTDLARMRARAEGGGRAQLRPIGVIRSVLKTRGEAPKQGSEGAPDAWLEVSAFAAQGLEGLAAGEDIIVVTWLHRARRDVLKVHPRSDRRRPLTGVFATRSPDRPNPLGLHRVTVRRVAQNRLRIGPSKPSTALQSLTSNGYFQTFRTSSMAQPLLGSLSRRMTNDISLL